MAQHFRASGAQVACQFQYDPRSLAGLNREWPQHWLNLWHTPEKMVSFMIGAEVFRRQPRGKRFDLPPDDQVFGPAAVSFHRNTALLATDDVYMRTGSVSWNPLSNPSSPQHVVSVGDSPYFHYEGSGVVDLHLGPDTAELRIYPDVERLETSPTGHASTDMVGSPDHPLTVLHEREHPFSLLLPKWADAAVERQENGHWIAVPGRGASFRVKPGNYRLHRSAANARRSRE